MAIEAVELAGPGFYVPPELTEAFADLGLKASDAALYFQWTRMGVFFASTAEQRPFAAMLTRLKQVLPRSAIDAVPSMVYRGMTLPRKLVEKALDGGSIPIKSRALSSWTPDRKAAARFGGNYSDTKMGVLLGCKATKANTILYIGPKLQAFWPAVTLKDSKGRKGKWHANKTEVVMLGAGLDSLTKRNILEHTE